MAKILSDLFTFERAYISQGKKIICGVDEAGRGPLAGPVSVAACIMPLGDPIPGVNDSKQLSAKERERLYALITERAVCYHVSLFDHKVIDEINILNATKRGMLESVAALPVRPEIVLVDAVKLDFGIPSEAIVHGDARSYSIACASILAKVTRDRLMEEYDRKFPEYGFARHKGYGTREHIAALEKYGRSPIHRESFLKKFDARAEQRSLFDEASAAEDET